MYNQEIVPLTKKIDSFYWVKQLLKQSQIKITSWFYFLSNLISRDEKVQPNKQTMLFHNLKIHLKIDGLIFYIYQFNVQSMVEFNKTIRQY